MSRLVLFPYKSSSKSVQKLRIALDAEDIDTSILEHGSSYRHRTGDVILGWGSGDWPSWSETAISNNVPWLNPCDRIMNSVNKAITFELFRAARIPFPEMTTRRGLASKWAQEGNTVLARKVMDGADGAGVVVIKPGARTIPEAKAYTKYFAPTVEFRVHVFRGKAFWAQERHPIEERDNPNFKSNPDYYVRTTKNGWTLYVANKICPEMCKSVAVDAVSAAGLDFAAVDVGWAAGGRGVRERACVYEVNTAPELSERTCAAYVKQLKTLTR